MSTLPDSAVTIVEVWREVYTCLFKCKMSPAQYIAFLASVDPTILSTIRVKPCDGFFMVDTICKEAIAFLSTADCSDIYRDTKMRIGYVCVRLSCLAFDDWRNSDYYSDQMEVSPCRYDFIVKTKTGSGADNCATYDFVQWYNNRFPESPAMRLAIL